MARRRISSRKKNQNRFSMFLVSLVVLAIVIVVSVRGRNLKSQMEAYEEQGAKLDKQIEAELERAEDIEEYGKYTQTKKFVEETAKEKLGLVYPDEIIFQEED